jgi:hypothetical protein
LIIATLIACAGAAVAWQTAISSVGWSEEQASRIAESFFTGGSHTLPGLSYLSPATKQRWIGRTPAEKAQAIRELALYARKYVQTPTFEKVYDGWIRQRYGAVNHGIRVDTNAGATAADVSAAMSGAASEMAKAFEQLDANALRMLLTHDLDSLKNSRRDSDKQMLERYRRVEGLLLTNLPEARKQYAIAKTMQMSGSTDEAQTQANLAAGAKFAAERKRMEEQRAWDEHNLKAELRRRLTEFIATAESVDFAAPTQRSAGKMVFANAELERKPSHWKVLYRLGKEPAMAAVTVAKQWLREL